MSTAIVLYIGIVICCVAAAGAIAAAVALRLSKARLNKQLTIEYGKRRH